MRSNLPKYFIIFLLPIFSAYGQQDVKIIAHRGASAQAPENTLIAFEKALQKQIRYIELDVRTSADDSMMVIHDETVDRTTNGTGQVAEMTYDELKGLSAGFAEKFGNSFRDTKIPTLLEALLLIKQYNAFAVIEPKSAANARLLNTIELAGMTRSTYIISYNFDKLSWILNKNPETNVLLLANSLTKGDVLAAADKGMYGVGAGLLTPNSVIGFAHDQGMEYWKGVVNDPAKMEFYKGAGVDGIFTDYPEIPAIMWTSHLFVARNPFYHFFEAGIINTDQHPDIEVRDINGKTIYQWKNDGTQIFRWYPEHRKPGIYLVLVFLDEKTEIYKIIYQRDF